MDTYSILREIADSWVLLLMVCFFVGAGIWAFWPGQRGNRDSAALIPFRNDVADTKLSLDPKKEQRHGR